MSRISFVNERNWNQFDTWFISDVINRIPEVKVIYPSDWSINRNPGYGTYPASDSSFPYNAEIEASRGYIHIRLEYPEFTILFDISQRAIHSGDIDSMKESIASNIIQRVMAHLDAIKLNGRIESWRFSYNYTGFIDRDFNNSLRNGEIWGYPTLQTEKIFRTNEKAERLLLSCLSKSQKEEYKNNSYFTVRGNVTGKKYRINSCKQINIEELDKLGNVTSKLCVVSNEYVPMEDHMLSQKLLIETNEELFLQTAIRW